MDINVPYNSIIQWNCRSLIKRMYLLKDLINIIQPFIICLQETFIVNDHNLDILKTLFKDFNFYFSNRTRVGNANPGGGVAIMVHKTVPQQRRQMNTHLESVTMDINFNGKNISVCSLYLPPGKTFTVPSLSELSSQLQYNHLILGDFNSHNTIWGSINTNHRGRLIEEFINTTDNVLLNTGEHTHISDATGDFSAIDVSLASPHLSLDVTWSTYTDSLRSNHLPIIIKIGAINPQTNSYVPLCKYRTENVDWGDYTSMITLDTSGNDIDSKNVNMVNSIIAAAETHTS